LRIDGEPEVPDCRPSPMQGNDRMPRFFLEHILVLARTHEMHEIYS
jgi:hypothetical protein